MKLFRIYTELKRPERLREIVGEYFKSFTVIEAEGCFEHHWEKTAIIEVWTDAENAGWFTEIAQRIGQANEQTAVAVVSLQADVTLLQKGVY